MTAVGMFAEETAFGRTESISADRLYPTQS